jgi:acyl-CoA thioesterase-1
MKLNQWLSACSLLFLVSCGNPPTNKTVAAEDNETTENSVETENKKIILFFGNSLTAGYGVQPDESFPARIQQRIDSLNLPYTVVNAGVSGETTTGGLGRIDWVLKNQKVDIFVLELGANDGLRGIDVNETRQNLMGIIDKVEAANPDVDIILAGMLVPPNMGMEYSKAYEAIFPEVAQQKQVDLIPFLLKDVGGVDSLNQGDGIHPNPAGAQILADNTWVILEKYLQGQD